MNALKTLACAGGWEVVLDANGIVSIRQGAGLWIYDNQSAYDAIKTHVKDPAVRSELLKQYWGNK